MEKQLELVVISDSLQLTTKGQIYPDVPEDNIPPVVRGVTASPGHLTEFKLKPGKYAYRFRVNMSGKFTVNIGPTSSLDPKKAEPFDTADGTKGRVYLFEVKP